MAPGVQGPEDWVRALVEEEGFNSRMFETRDQLRCLGIENPRSRTTPLLSSMRLCTIALVVRRVWNLSDSGRPLRQCFSTRLDLGVEAMIQRSNWWASFRQEGETERQDAPYM